MKITDLLAKESISLSLQASSKPEAINELVELMAASGKLTDKAIYKEGIIAREAQSTTGIGEGIAIPHAKSSAVKQPGLAAAVSKSGVDYESFDGSLAHLFFMIAAPEGANNTHLEVLSRLSTILMDESFRQDLMNTSSVDAFLALIDTKEKEKFPEEVETKEEAPVVTDSKYPKVLAVTACPTGIAHTFMAAESLNKKGDELGISIKVETNGSAGVKNVLTKEEIEHAEAIIVAADKKVEMARFNGKKVIITKVADGIHKAEELVTRAATGDAPVYTTSETSDQADSTTNESIGRQLYKHLMNGVSNMLPFVIAGGLLTAIAFLLDNYEIDPSNFGSNTPQAAFFKQVGGAAFSFMLPMFAGFIASSIADRPAFVAGVTAGFLANAGGAGFLGALAAGFIAGYVVLGLKRVFTFLPDSLEGLKPTLLYPLFGTLLMGAIMIFLVNPPVAAINNAMTDFLQSLGGSSKILLGIVVAGMMAIDMGGPINKAAYVFGVASLEAGAFEVMAAVMAGGMVPPLAIGLATTFAKQKFTKEQQDAGKVNYIMGLSFITEGAIPFAAADPLRVIPACVVGSSVAGALAMAFNTALPAPHGGIFVLPVITNPLGYLAAILIGSIVGAILLAVFKKKPTL